MRMRKGKALIMMERKMMRKVNLKPSRRESSKLVKLRLKRVKSSLRSQPSSRRASGILMLNL
jgi:hypothetical protein